MPDEAQGKNTDSLAVLKALAEASAVFIALTFVGGWSYLASYYKMFGLNPLELEMPVPVVSTIAVHMLYDSPWAWPLIVVGTLLAVLAIVFHRFHGIGRGWIVATVTVLLVLSATAGLVRGRQVANQDMLEEVTALPNVTFFTAKVPANFGRAMPDCVAFETTYEVEGEPGFCRLLLHSQGVYYFFQSISASQAAISANIDVYVIPDSEIEAVQIQRGRED